MANTTVVVAQAITLCIHKFPLILYKNFDSKIIFLAGMSIIIICCTALELETTALLIIVQRKITRKNCQN